MTRDFHPRSGSWIRILIFYPSRIPDPGIKKTPDPGSGSATLVTSDRKKKAAETEMGWAVYENVAQVLQTHHDNDSRHLNGIERFNKGKKTQLPGTEGLCLSLLIY
jgi:hypothetical protein